MVASWRIFPKSLLIDRPTISVYTGEISNLCAAEVGGINYN
jgi:hypothetical protein